MNWKPLSERLRPEKIEEVFGQDHLTGQRGILTKLIQNKNFYSMIFYGPPGTGKTTVGKIIGKNLPVGFELVYFSAALQGTQDLKKLFLRAEQMKKYGGQLIILIDEIHRLNKLQQDVLLHHTETGIIVIIGCTTENPSFEINSALLSRCSLIIFKKLSPTTIINLIKKAIEKDEDISKISVKIDEDVLQIISENCEGDARKALNLIETLLETADSLEKEILDLDTLNELAVLPSGRYSKKGDEHYDLISAFIKSMRGSDPDAALFYMVKMLEGGEDPKYIARRMIILASEDIGLADPMSLVIATAAFKAVEQIGLPECKLNLAEAAIYLSVAPKSNSSYKALKSAVNMVQNNINLEVPLKLRNPVTDLMKKMNYGKDYVYPHNLGGYYKTTYLPDSIKNEIFYIPTENGREKAIKERLIKLWKDYKKYDN